MAISYNQIPNNLRIPFVCAEFDSSRAQQGPSLLAYRGLIVGQKIAAGGAAADKIYKVTSADQVATLAGRGSLLHRMAIAWFASNKSTELNIGVLADAESAVAATGTLTFTGPATAAGTLNIYIGGDRVQVAVAKADTASAIATAVVAAITAAKDLPVTAAATDGVVTLTARNKGECGNAIDLRMNYQDGEVLPAGVTVTIVAMASGATNPTLTNLIAAMGDSWYHVIPHPYTDATSLTAIETEMASRAGPMRMIDGVAITCASGSHATLGTLGDGRNSQYSWIFAQPGVSPITPSYELAAEAGAVIAYYGQIDPARPFQTLPLVHAKPPAEGDLFSNEERNLLLFDGIATTKVVGGVVQLDRAITTYQTNAAGAADTAYLDGNTVLTLMYLRYDFNNRWATKYPRHKLADDGTRFGAGQAVMTPKLGKAEAIAWFRDMEELGLVEGADQFKRDLVVERNATDRNRLDFMLPPDLINQLIVTAAKIGFLN